MQTEDLEAHRSQGLCSFYIRRFDRFCRKRSGVNPLCSDHAPANLSEIRERTFQQQKTRSDSDAPKSRRARISSSQKRMMNPLNVCHSNALSSWIDGLDCDKELMVDVGCARGTMLHRLALTNPTFNYCGLEIRSELVNDANQKARTQGLDKRLRFLACSANASFQTLFRKHGYCDSLDCWSRRPCPLHHFKLRLVSVLFPDPWKRGKHQRRRVMNAQFVDQLAASLDEGAVVYMCSDVPALATEMRDLLMAHPCFSTGIASRGAAEILSLLSVPSPSADSTWLSTNPLPVGSERDQVSNLFSFFSLSLLSFFLFLVCMRTHSFHVRFPLLGVRGAGSGSVSGTLSAK